MNIRIDGGTQFHEKTSWIEWYGGECPVGKDDVVECVFRDGCRAFCLAGAVVWKPKDRRYDIIKYRVIPEQNTDWIEWNGWDNFQVPQTTLVEFRKMSGETYKTYSIALMPIHDKLTGDHAITHYRVIG